LVSKAIFLSKLSKRILPHGRIDAAGDIDQ